jgi:hypothetical protein
MTAVLFIHPLNGRSPTPREAKGTTIEGLPWGTPTGAEVERLLDTVQQAVEGALVRRSEAIGLLVECHMMLHRCCEAIAPVALASRKGV